MWHEGEQACMLNNFKLCTQVYVQCVRFWLLLRGGVTVKSQSHAVLAGKALRTVRLLALLDSMCRGAGYICSPH